MADESDESLGALLGRLADDARGYVHAEVDYYRTLSTERLREARMGLTLGGVALVLAIAGAIALVVGSVMALASLIGAGFATLLVVVLTFVVAALFGWLAYRRLSGLFRSEP